MNETDQPKEKYYSVLAIMRDGDKVGIAFEDEETTRLAYQNMLDLRKSDDPVWSNANTFIDLRNVIVLQVMIY